MKSPNLLNKIVTKIFAKEKCEQVYRRVSDGLEIKSRMRRTLKAMTTLWGRRSKSGTLPKTKTAQVKKKAIALAKEKSKQICRRVSDGLEIKSRVRRTLKAIKTLWGRRSKSGRPSKRSGAQVQVKKKAIALAKEKLKQVCRHVSSKLSIKFGLLRYLSKSIIKIIAKVGQNRTIKKSEPKRIGVMKHIGYLLAVVALAFAVEFLERQGASRAALLIAVIGGVVISVSWILNKIDHK